MKNRKMILGIAIVMVIGLTVIACNKSGGSSSGGGKALNSAEELKAYLDKQPANSPDKPIKVSMGVNEPMIPKILDVLNSAGKYVSLNLTGNALTNIPNYAFGSCKTLVSVIIPNSVTSIGEKAFYYCTSLASITIPNSVTSIGKEAFYDCTSLASITIPNSVTSIGDRAFYDCTSLTSVTIPNSVTSIGIMAFNNCASLASVTIGSGVTSIWTYAFSNCTSLTSVTFQGTISSDNFGKTTYDLWRSQAFEGDLKEKYLAGGKGTYTTTTPVPKDSRYWEPVWTKQ